MFKFLKDKLNATIAKISEKIRAEGREEVVEEAVEEIVEKPSQKAEEKPIKKPEEKAAEESKPEEKRGFFESPKKPSVFGAPKIRSIFEGIKEVFIGKEAEQKEKEEQAELEKVEEEKIAIAEKAELREVEAKKEEKPKHVPKKEEEKPKKGFFHAITEKIVTKKINEKQFEDLFWDLELALLENNVAVEVIEKIKEDLKIKLVDTPIKRTKVEETITENLALSIKSLFHESDIDLLKLVKRRKPYIICFFGINGSGKTTSIAKIAKLLKDHKLSVVISASDTFRAASIDQLQKHADALGVKLIKHDYGSDPAAVAFDAIKHAESKKVDVVLIDTAGRMHSNTNLIDEMKKIIRVAKPDLKIFVGEAITGNDCVEQAKTFNDAIGIDAIILAKADIDEKGGAAVSVSYVTKKPILFLGTGQKYEDLQKFEPDIIIKGLGLEA